MGGLFSRRDYAFGCRHPESTRFSWDRAFVACKTRGSITAAYFDGGMDYIQHPVDRSEAQAVYDGLVKDHGHLPMDAEDIEKTAGLKSVRAF